MRRQQPKAQRGGVLPVDGILLTAEEIENLREDVARVASALSSPRLGRRTREIGRRLLREKTSRLRDARLGA